MDPIWSSPEVARRLDEATKELYAKLTRPQKDPPRNHHYLPKFYLRRWAEDGCVRVLDRTTGELRKKGLRRAAAETDFYTVETDKGEEDFTVERLLSYVENESAKSIQRVLDAGPAAADLVDIQQIAMYLGFQMARGPDVREQMDFMADYTTKTLEVEGVPPDRNVARARLKAKGIPFNDDDVDAYLGLLRNPDRFEFRASRNHSIKFMLDSCEEFARVLLVKQWTMLRFVEPLVITTDQPLTVVNRPGFGAGIINCDYAYFPLSPSDVLLFSTGPPHPPQGFGGNFIEYLNRHLAHYAHKSIIGPPSHPMWDDLSGYVKRVPRPEWHVEEHDQPDGSTVVHMHRGLPNSIATRTAEFGPKRKFAS